MGKHKLNLHHVRVNIYLHQPFLIFECMFKTTIFNKNSHSLHFSEVMHTFITIAKNSSVKILTPGAINDEMLKNVKRHVNHFCRQQQLKQIEM